MLKDFVRAAKPDEKELKKEIKLQQEQLAAYQMQIKERKLPVMVIFEGWGAAGKGTILGRVIRELDPRFFHVVSMAAPTREEKRYPFLYRYMQEIPEEGKFTFYDRYWMEEITDGLMKEELSPDQYKKRVESIIRTERALIDNGYLIMKFFCDISCKEQKNRLKELEKDDNTSWRVTDADWFENSHYEDYQKIYDSYLSDTSGTGAPWYIIDSNDSKWGLLQVLRFLNQGIGTALKNASQAAPIRQNRFPLEPAAKLSAVSLDDKILDEKVYKKKLDKLQDRLSQLHNEIYRRKIPVVIVYEGWDAAGKGGNIKRITAALDPRGYEVEPIPAPEPHEKARFYLWRFWKRLPKDGHISIFDRSWYGRVMVERLEGFCSENDWQRAYNEINEFEKELDDWGAVIIKFWVQIDKETQLARFTDRQNTPEKQWKITEEDWRNREKWDLYEGAVDEMLEKTNCSFAPWYILESNDKKYARIKALEIVISRLEEACRRDH